LSARRVPRNRPPSDQCQQPLEDDPDSTEDVAIPAADPDVYPGARITVMGLLPVRPRVDLIVLQQWEAVIHTPELSRPDPDDAAGHADFLPDPMVGGLQESRIDDDEASRRLGAGAGATAVVQWVGNDLEFRVVFAMACPDQGPAPLGQSADMTAGGGHCGRRNGGAPGRCQADAARATRQQKQGANDRETEAPHRWRRWTRHITSTRGAGDAKGGRNRCQG